MVLVTLNTPHREQNHHQFKKTDDAPQKNIKKPTLLQKENKPKQPYVLAKKYLDEGKKFRQQYLPWLVNFSSTLAALIIFYENAFYCFLIKCHSRMNKILLECFLFAFLLISCNESSKNTFLTKDQIDAMSINDMIKYTTESVDPFTKKKTYFLSLFKESGIENKYASCLIDSISATLMIEPNVFLSDDATVKIISAHNPVDEFFTIGSKNYFILGIDSNLKYFKDEDVHIRLASDYNNFDLSLDKNELRGIYLAYNIHKKFSPKMNE